MKLNRLLSILPEISSENLKQDAEVTGLFNDARLVTPGCVFVAIKGSALDGHKFLPDAVAKGASALVVEETSLIPEGFAGIVMKVENSRAALDLLASRFYLDPGQELFCVGVTGTNGKTSVTYMIEAILNAGHIPTGVVGTINHHLKEKIWPSEMTTPDPVFLQKRLREFRDEGALAAALEVSSHALDQKRVESVPFNTVIFTNLTRDHLDYHKDMDRYFEAKQRLFTDLLWKTPKSPCYAIINTADKYGRKMRVAGPAVLWTYGDKDSDLRYKIKKMNFALTHFEVHTPRGSGEVFLPMSGVHNVLNALAAIGAGISAGISLEICIQALNGFTGVPGRLQSVVNDKDLSVFVDYAHSPDALENVLRSLNQVRENLQSPANIWTIFGCGGDRDKGKRPLMAQVALRYSDQVVITSDNPRTEDPESIIQEILTGVAGADKTKTLVIADRAEAIRTAIQKAADGDVILIAGKGHEDYQIIGKEKRPFSDVGVADKALKERSQ